MLKTVLNGVTLKNPVIAASGTFGFGQDYDQFFDISRLGGISSKGLTLEERFGNEGERIYETPSGLINSIGLQNPGVDAFIREDLPFLRQKDTAVIANLGGSTIESYLEGVEKLNETDVDMIEHVSYTHLIDQTALAGNAEFARKIAADMGDDLHRNSVLHRHNSFTKTVYRFLSSLTI